MRKGLGYSDAVILAKLPDIIGHEQWITQENDFLPLVLEIFDNVKQKNIKQKTRLKQHSPNLKYSRTFF